MIHMRLIAAAAVMCWATPALADKNVAVTPSGSTEMLFAERPQAVISKLSSGCIDRKWTIVSSSTNDVVCEAPLNMGQSIMGQMLMGNSYSTPPRRFFRFTVAEVNGISRVQAAGWMELQMAFGQTKRQDFSGPEFHNGALAFMSVAGGKYPIGTTFPNHAALGVEADDVALGKYVGFRITEIHPGRPADKAGLKIGDVVTAIAGKRFKNTDNYLDATAKAAGAPTYEVEISRDGREMKVTVERAFRPPVTEQLVAQPETPAPATRPTMAPTVADELTKLAKLKSEGVLSEEEFQAQKKKLLEQ